MPRPKPKATDDNPLRDASRPGAVRLQRVLADAGVASRRHCEAMILQGAVSVNGEIVDALPVWVCPEEDRIEVEGRPLPRRKQALKEATRHIYVMLYKPRRSISTAADPAGRRTVVDMVNHPSGARLFPVGRLDYDTSGLIILTNDGDLANGLTHPRYGVHKTYRATVKGSLDDEAFEELRQGVFLTDRKEGVTVGASRTARTEMRLVKRDRERTIIEITLFEGRNRQVRRMFAKLGHPVRQLVRVGMGPVRLKALKTGEWRELTREEIRDLRRAAKGVKSLVELDDAPRTAGGARPKTPRATAGKGAPRSRRRAR
ncbi:MAG: rRNA pseudouridine synthase [Phycisphaerales bacterium]|nr:MAG: rRNA pseudouridine synthase [Phycisphaerales bacterium]